MLARYLAFTRRPAMLAALLLGLPLVGTAQTTYYWTAGSQTNVFVGDENYLWSNAANWEPNGVPSGYVNVVISSAISGGRPGPIHSGFTPLHSLNLSGLTATVGTLAVTNLTVISGTLSGAVSVEAAGAWTGGAVAGTFDVPASATVTLSGAATKTISPNTTLNNAGQMLWQAGTINLGNSALLHNTGLFLATANDVFFNYTGGALPLFLNEGTFLRQTGTGNVIFRADNGGVFFTNRANVEIQTGVLSLPAGSAFADGGNLSGDGLISLDGVTTFSGTNILQLYATLRLAGTLSGLTATIKGGGTLSWVSGSLYGALDLGPGVTVKLEGGATKTLAAGAQVRQSGPALWQDAGGINLGNGASWVNAGTFDILNDALCYNHTGGVPTPVFQNNGLLRKLAGAGTTIWRSDNGGVRFNSTGPVQVQSGTLSLNGGGTLTNLNVSVATNTFLDFGAGTFEVFDPAGISGPGRVRVPGAAMVFNDVSVTVAGGSTLELSGGAFYSTAALAGSGLFQWSGGSLYGTLTVPAGLGFQINGGATKFLRAGAALTNLAAGVWSDVGDLNFGNGSLWHNAGSLECQSDRLLFNFTGGSPAALFRNLGTLTKTGGSGTTTFRSDNGGVLFTNAGTVSVQSGAISFQGGTLLAAAGVFSGAGQTRLDSSTTLFGTSTIATNARVQLTSVLGGTGGFDGSGTFEWVAGNLVGDTTLGANLTLELTTGNTRQLQAGARLTDLGPAFWLGTGQMNVGNGSVWNNLGTFEARTNSSFFNYSGGLSSPAFNNPGMFRRTTAAGTLTFRSENGGVRFNNSGTVEAQTGLLSLQGGGGNTNGLFLVATNAQLDFASGTHEFLGAAWLVVDGTARFNGASLLFNDTTNIVSAGALLEASAGALTGSGTVGGAGTFRWSGGGFYGTQTVLAGLAFDISGAGTKTLNSGARLNNFASATWRDGGLLYCGVGSVFANPGTLDVQNGSDLFNYTGGLPLPRLENSGLLLKSAGGLTRFRPDNGGVLCNNTGTVQADAGVLSFQAGGSHTNGLFQVGNSGQLEFTAGTHEFRNASHLLVSGTARANGASLVFYDTTNTVTAGGLLEASASALFGTGSVGGPGTFRWNGGSFSGVQTVLAEVAFDISGAATKTLNSGARLNNHASATWRDAGLLYCGSASVLANLGTFDVQNGSDFYNHTAGMPLPRFENGGRFLKSAGGLTRFRPDNGGVLCNNAGTVQANAGVLSLQAGGNHTNGLFLVGTNGQLDFPGGTHDFRNDSHLQVSGIARANGASLVFYDATNTVMDGGLLETLAGALYGPHTVAGPGTFRWSGGTLAGPNTVQTGVVFDISSASTKTLAAGAALTNLTSANWRDAGLIYCGNGSVFANVGTLDAQSDSAFYNHTAGAPLPRLANTGLFRKSAGSLTRFRPDNGGVFLTNSAVVDIQAGTLTAEGGAALGAGGSFTGAGTMSLDSGTTLYGTNTLAAGATLRLNSALSGTGRFDGPGTFNWNGGSLNGVLATGTNTTLSLTGGTKVFTPGAKLDTFGTNSWTAGDLHLGSSSQFANHGLWEVRNSAILYNNTAGTPLPVVANLGLLRKLASPGVTTFRSDNGGVVFTNSGTVDLRTGTLQLDGLYQPASGAPFAFELNDPTPTIGYGRVIRGSLPVNGPLLVTFASGYMPTNGSTFTLAAYSARSGEFSPVTLPALPVPLFWTVTQGPTAVVIAVHRGTLLSQPTRLPDGSFQFQIIGDSATSALIEASTNFVNWVPLTTNTPFNGSLLFNDPTAVTLPYRFYRVQTQP